MVKGFEIGLHQPDDMKVLIMITNIKNAKKIPKAIHHRSFSCNFCSKFFRTINPIVNPDIAPMRCATNETEGVEKGSLSNLE